MRGITTCQPALRCSAHVTCTRPTVTPDDAEVPETDSCSQPWVLDKTAVTPPARSEARPQEGKSLPHWGSLPGAPCSGAPPQSWGPLQRLLAFVSPRQAGSLLQKRRSSRASATPERKVASWQVRALRSPIRRPERPPLLTPPSHGAPGTRLLPAETFAWGLPPDRPVPPTSSGPDQLEPPGDLTWAASGLMPCSPLPYDPRARTGGVVSYPAGRGPFLAQRAHRP